MKIIKSAALSIALGLAVSGCASPEQKAERQAAIAERKAAKAELKRAEQAKWEALMPVCNSDEQCADMWEAAEYWIVSNAGYKLQTATGIILETFNPSAGTLSLRVRAVKEPLGGGEYRITVRTWCNNPFGCDRNVNDAAVDFYKTVGAAGS